MKKLSRILIGSGFVALLLISWIVAINSKSTAEKQDALIERASKLAVDNIYILAVPLLEEAAGYNAANTLKAEEALKIVYLKLADTRGFSRKYTELLEKQMSRKEAGPEVFEETAEYYLEASKITEALDALKDGIAKTGDAGLIEMYEYNRYKYEMSRTSYDYVAAISGSTVQVRADGLWGLARADGTALIECEYDKISTYSGGRAIVKKNGEIYAVDSNNNRVAKLHLEDLGFGEDDKRYTQLRLEDFDFGNYGNNRVPFLIEGEWRRANGDFEFGASTFQNFGMYSGGYAAAKTGGKWGVVDLAAKWLVPAEFDEIKQDELGRCYAQKAVFARQGGAVYMYVGGEQVGNVYEDAHPFSEEGFAAVKKNGKWGFIDTAGTEIIGFMFDDALSFGQHLAAVKIDDLWGYINISGKVVIEPIFIEAKSFSNGTAPVLTERGWQFITLLEYKKKVGL